MINGCGTAFIGKSNVRKRPTLCDQCRSNRYVTDYTVNHYVMLLFVPVFRLGKKRVLNRCPICDYGLVYSLADWQRRKQDGIDRALSDLGAAKDSVPLALELLQLLSVFGEDAEAVELATILVQHHQKDVSVLVQGGWFFEFQGRLPDAEKCFERAQRLAPDHPEVLKVQLFNYVDAKNYSDAERILSIYHNAGGTLDVMAARLLVVAFQEGGHPCVARQVQDKYGL